jgi:hypothetical protein
LKNAYIKSERITTVPSAFVKQTSDHCETAEFPMKAYWKEDAQAVASEPQKKDTYEELKVK